MSRAGASLLVGLLLVGGCGGKVEGPDGCGTGRPRWVPVPAPEAIDMEFQDRPVREQRPVRSPRFGNGAER